MKQKIIIVLIIILSAGLTAGTTADEFCTIRNRSFQAGENITFIVYYNALGLYINAGSANFIVSQEKMGNKPVYHITGTGVTNSSYDWIFKVRDSYETFLDTATLKPYKFIRNVQEGSYKKYENVTFNQSSNTAITTQGVFKVPPCVQDVISAVFYARNIDFNSYKTGDKISFSMFIDNEIYNMYIRYLGKETVKTQYGKFRAIKFKPLLVKGTLFEGGENMTVWVSDDNNKIPLRIESPIVVGSVKADMMSYRGLRYPLSSLISFR